MNHWSEYNSWLPPNKLYSLNLWIFFGNFISHHIFYTFCLDFVVLFNLYSQFYQPNHFARFIICWLLLSFGALSTWNNINDLLCDSVHSVRNIDSFMGGHLSLNHYKLTISKWIEYIRAWRYQNVGQIYSSFSLYAEQHVESWGSGNKFNVVS